MRVEEEVQSIRTGEEIEKAVERLKINKQRCNRYSYFKDDNYECIDLMIEVLVNNYDEKYIESLYKRKIKEDKRFEKYFAYWDSAFNALRFREGQLELEEILYPEDSNKGN